MVIITLDPYPRPLPLTLTLDPRLLPLTLDLYPSPATRDPRFSNAVGILLINSWNTDIFLSNYYHL